MRRRSPNRRRNFWIGLVVVVIIVALVIWGFLIPSPPAPIPAKTSSIAPAIATAAA